VSEGAEKSTVYKLKSTTGKLNANVSLYNEEQLQHIKDTIGDQLYYFGYVNHPTEENPTTAFTFEKHSEENLKQWNGFRKLNEASLKEVTSPEKPDRLYHINTGEGCRPIFALKDLPNLQTPAVEWGRMQVEKATK